jgi:protein gp37
MAASTIEWTEATWNPTTGCSKVSQGCKFCYAEVMSKRLRSMGVEKYSDGFEIAMHEEELMRPFSWKKPKLVFVNSMSDLFHESVTDEFIHKVFDTMCSNSKHTFQILTKRTQRLAEMSSDLRWEKNIWIGTSIENQHVAGRLSDLKRVPAAIRFLSCEPLLGPLEDLDLTGVNWLIAGGESGPKARPMKEKWVLSLKDQCMEHGVKFFFKQWGGKNKKRAGRVLQGQTYDEMPNIQ